MKDAKYKAIDVACRIIDYSKKNEIPLTHLKLQKILYYIQAEFIVKFDMPCFEEGIFAWRHGPVIGEVYQEFKYFGGSVLNSVDLESELIYMTDDELTIIEQVTNLHVHKNVWKLVNETHNEIWTQEKCLAQEEITKEEIKVFFLNRNNKV